MIGYLLLVIVIQAILQCTYTHSGLYLVNTSVLTKDYAASWLISKNRFLKAEANIRLAKDLETATFRVTRQNCKNCVTLKTRDFFDFMVEHLSTCTNHIPNLEPVIFNDVISRMVYSVRSIKYQPVVPDQDNRLSKTMAILIYSSNSFSKSSQSLQRSIRPAFFQATFWSVYQHIKHIIVYVASEADVNVVKSMTIPYALLNKVTTIVDHKNRTSLLSRDSLLHALESIKAGDPFYSKYEYVFFSEGDQIVHIREPGVLFDVIDNSGGTFLTVPHRMQTLTLMQDFPMERHHLWPKVHSQNAPKAVIALESINAQGSCCGNGDVDVAPCKGWWYQCPTYGIKDLNPWLKFGDTGYTIPPVTAHRELCEYSASRRLCPMPIECMERFPTPGKGLFLTPLKFCKEISKVTRLGY